MPTLNEENIEDITIRELFALPLDSPPELVAGLQAKDFENLEKKISALSQPIPWSSVQSEVAGRISAALNTGLLDAWACAWKKYQTVKADVEESRKSPDRLVLSPLAQHSVDSTLHPYVEVFLGSVRLEKILFDVTLTTAIKGLILGLKDGCMVSLQVAECEWTGSISLQGVSLIERKLTKIDIPGRIALKHGVSLVMN